MLEKFVGVIYIDTELLSSYIKNKVCKKYDATSIIALTRTQHNMNS